MADQLSDRPVRWKNPRVWITGGLCCAVVFAGLILWRRGEPNASHAAVPPRSTAATVTTVGAAIKDVPIYVESLGTVQASNTIAVHSQIDGRLQSVNFAEGQEVHRGDVLVQIDPRPFQASLDQAIAKKGQDQAQLVSAQKDLERFRPLAAKGFETQQNVDQQQAKVDQFKAAVDADQAAIESAQVQLSYTTIKAPIDARVGFRQIDAGNIVHASDPTPITVLTQLKPAVVVMTLPQKELGNIREAMLRGTVTVLAYDQDNAHQLASGQLLLVDNQIDQTTSTIRLKATFANEDTRLWPGEFVKLHTLIDTRKGALTIPTAALQRGPDGFYAWLVKPDHTAEQRPIEIASTQGEIAIVTSGLSSGDRVVTRGQYRLQAGTPVEERSDNAANPDRPS